MQSGVTEQKKSQYVGFVFYRLRRAWWSLDEGAREQGKNELNRVLEEYSSVMILRAYTTLGIRAECDFMLWRISYTLEDFYEMSAKMLKTSMGPYLQTVYSYLSISKRSTYIDKISPEHGESRTTILPGKFKYIFVYPFIKTRAWYQLPLETRQTMMDEHIRTGNKYPSVKLNTTYSFGLDDQEFVVAFESDVPKDFLDLVQELRESKASGYTLQDTPTFTCIAKPLAELLNDF